MRLGFAQQSRASKLKCRKCGKKHRRKADCMELSKKNGNGQGHVQIGWQDGSGTSSCCVSWASQYAQDGTMNCYMLVQRSVLDSELESELADAQIALVIWIATW